MYNIKNFVVIKHFLNIFIRCAKLLHEIRNLNFFYFMDYFSKYLYKKIRNKKVQKYKKFRYYKRFLELFNWRTQVTPFPSAVL